MIFAEIFGPDALVVIVLAVVLLLGVNRLPQLARSLGEAARELRHNESDTDPATDDDDPDGSRREADTVTLTKAELDALLAEREAKAIRESRQAEYRPTEVRVAGVASAGAGAQRRRRWAQPSSSASW